VPIETARGGKDSKRRGAGKMCTLVTRGSCGSVVALRWLLSGLTHSA